MKTDYAARARALVGTPFRPQGRGEDGLDCIGVILATFGIPPEAVRRDYRLRGNHLDALREGLAAHFRAIPKGQLRAGDVMLLKCAPGHFHMGVRTSLGFVHAHAGIRRVVETPGAPEWPLIGAYRKRRGN